MTSNKNLVLLGIIILFAACTKSKPNKQQKEGKKNNSVVVQPIVSENKIDLNDSLIYRKRIVDFLLNPSQLPDSLIKPLDSLGIPGLDLEKYTSKKLLGNSKKARKMHQRLVNFKNGIFLIAKTGKSLVFKNGPAKNKKGGKQFKFCAYDNLFNTLYLAEIKRDSNFVVFGVCLNTGAIFDLWKSDSLTAVNSQYTYAFSPNFRWLLKTANADGAFSTVLLDVSTGNEINFTENSLAKYTHFSLQPKWIDNTTFSFKEIQLAFDGEIYNKDYTIFLAASSKKSTGTYKLKNLPIKGDQYMYKINPGNTSTELISKKNVDL